MKKFIPIIYSLVLLAFFTACNNDDDGTPDMQGEESIADIVANTAEYSTLAMALDITGLTATLAADGEFTVFAPNNAAFQSFLDANGIAGLNDVPVPVLREILLNHVVGGVNMSQDLSTGYVNTLATGASSTESLSMFIDLNSGVRINGVANVTTADIGASNGVVHA